MKIRKWSFVIALLAIALVAAVFVAGCQKPAASAQAQTLYHCPMHPDYVSDKPGDCPICGMRLVPMERKKSGGPKVPPSPPGGFPPSLQGSFGEAGGEASRKSETSAPARQPAVVEASRPEPIDPRPSQAGRPEPIDQKPSQASQPQTMPDMPGMPGVPSGTRKAGPVAIPTSPTGPTRPNLAGVQTVAAVKGTLTGTIRAVGTVVMPETGVRQVTTKVAGWVEKLYLNASGVSVRAGQPLFDLYSPELLASQEEYLHARQVAAQFASSSVPEVQRGGQDLVTSARRRLELFDVPPEFLARLEQTGKAQRTVTFRAPFSGYVMDKNVVEGQRIEPGMNLMTIADLSHAWVTAQLYEAEAGAAQPGRVARVSLPYDDTVKLTGRIDLVYPTLDSESRTLKVRVQFPNPKLALKPGMFVNVEIDAQRAQGVIVPDSALIDTGTRQVVFVQTQPGHFEPRDVQAGLRSDGKVILRSGVQAGEQVAVAANFLLDSESRLRGAIR